jgi:hypothetical protein
LLHVTPDIRARLVPPPEPEPEPPPMPPFWRRHLVAMVGLLAVLFGLADVGIWWRYYRHPPAMPISAGVTADSPQ